MSITNQNKRKFSSSTADECQIDDVILKGSKTESNEKKLKSSLSIDSSKENLEPRKIAKTGYNTRIFNKIGLFDESSNIIKVPVYRLIDVRSNVYKKLERPLAVTALSPIILGAIQDNNENSLKVIVENLSQQTIKELLESNDIKSFVKEGGKSPMINNLIKNVFLLLKPFLLTPR